MKWFEATFSSIWISFVIKNCFTLCSFAQSFFFFFKCKQITGWVLLSGCSLWASPACTVPPQGTSDRSSSQLSTPNWLEVTQIMSEAFVWSQPLSLSLCLSINCIVQCPCYEACSSLETAAAAWPYPQTSSLSPRGGPWGDPCVSHFKRYKIMGGLLSLSIFFKKNLDFSSSS